MSRSVRPGGGDYNPNETTPSAILGDEPDSFHADGDGNPEVATNLGPMRRNRRSLWTRALFNTAQHLTLEKPTNQPPEEVGTALGREFKGHQITHHVQLRDEKVSGTYR
ncbi:MAG: hypothetical protein U5J63_17830 [Fodinibius sp.]|nr:hypothetical protein [Fodinibius sp.]